jgi:LmbE family N-acetylglucosaminyl deacetylase
MMGLMLGGRELAELSILCLGAHSDDIEIGCGGTILKLLEKHKRTHVTWVVLGAEGVREEEARKSAGMFLAKATTKDIEVKGFRDGFFPYIGGEIKEHFERLKSRVSPDIIFTHYRNDLHQDHRLVSELTGNTFRNHLVLEYEILKYDGDIGNPNVSVPLSREIVDRKTDYIIECFESQRRKPWFTPSAFKAILRLRGVESNALDDYAEGFYGRKLVLD